MDNNIFTFKVQEAYSGDALKGLARIHPDDMSALELSEGDLVGITGRRITTARIRTGDREAGRGIIQIDGLIRENAGASLDDTITIEPHITHHFASRGRKALRQREGRKLHPLTP